MSIGDGWCTGIEVTWNLIICSPPDELPGYRKKRSLQKQKKEFRHLDRIPRQIQDETEEFGSLNEAALNLKTLLEMSRNQKHNAESALPEKHRRPYKAPNNANGKKHVHSVNSHSAKAPAADHVNKLRMKRQIRNVQVAIIVHAGANLKMNAGSIIYRIPEKKTTQSTPTVPTSNPNVTTSPTELEPAAITSGDSHTVVTAVASVFGVLAFLTIATALGNNRHFFVLKQQYIYIYVQYRKCLSSVDIFCYHALTWQCV